MTFLGLGPGRDFVLLALPKTASTALERTLLLRAARVVVEPPESHGDHCLTVAVYGVLVAPVFGADPVAPFLVGLAHHLHNVVLPDAGFAGEVLLGAALDRVLTTLEERWGPAGFARIHRSTLVSLRHVDEVRSDAGRCVVRLGDVELVVSRRHSHRARCRRPRLSIARTLGHWQPERP